MKLTKISSAIICTLSIAGLTACGSGGGDSSATSGNTVVGTITGFGSIIMNNGVEYGTDNVSGCDIDDRNTTGKCDDDLNVGMRVSLKTDANGNVTSLKYDDELEGPAIGVTGMDGNFMFTVFGVKVTTTSPETQWDDFTSAAPTPTAAELEGKIVEVSGEWQGDTLVASYVEEQNDNEFEAKGTVSNSGSGGFTLTLRDGISIIEVATNENIADGTFVEVKGTLDTITNIFTASEIEIEDEDDFDDESEVEITGKLVANDPGPGHTIGNTDVDIDNAPSCTDQVGSIVEAEGVYNPDTGVLIVEECENEDEDLEMKCDVTGVSAIDAAAPKVGTVMCDFPGTTGGPVTIEFRDSPNLAMFSGDTTANTFDLRNVNVDDCVEIKASIDASSGSDVYVAGLIEHEGAGACSEYELEGPVDAISATEITSLGITYMIAGSTVLPDGSTLSGGGTLPVVVDGTTLKIKDNDGDGTADAIED